MFNKFITHLKNIIFFKTVLVIIAIFLFYNCIPVLLKDLSLTENKQQKASISLENMKLKLASMTDFEQKIPILLQKYNDLKQKSVYDDCFDREYFVNQIAQLNDKYHLFNPINVLVSRELNQEEAQYSIYQIRLNEYEIQISFSCDNLTSLLQLLADINLLLPPGSTVTNTIIEEKEGLTLAMIEQLNNYRSPALLTAYMQIHLQEIIYVK